MKIHTNDFKLQIKEAGRQIDSIITYIDGNEEITLHDELYKVTPHYNANLLKSVMKQLDIESTIDIPLNTIINYQFGLLVNNSYEYIDFGNYVVYKSEKQEDLNRYKIICYDKMLYAMKQNEDLGLTYPITIKNYLNAIGTAIGLNVKNTTFANQDLTIPTELYAGLNYTYRDILDEISQATGSNIVINNDDELEVRYFTSTNDTIDEHFLKNINVNFGERYGNINTLVLTRSAGADSIYYPSILPENPIEIKIEDNQIMNFNNRVDFMPGILNKISQFYYYINDFSSTGICYYDVCDIYNINIDNNTYQCVMLNDEINVTTGLEEIIYTEMPEESVTDYNKADKTDRRINETYLIVDKQNQEIESVISNVTEQDQKIATISQTVEELNSKISDIADITVSQETNNASLTFTDINQSEPIRIEIHPIVTNISYLYPRANLYPSDLQYLPDRKIRFTNTNTDEVVDYELPTDLLYYDSNNYDEFILDYDSQTCIVNKRVGYNADGTTYVLTTPTTISYTYPQILLNDGDYTVELVGYSIGYMMVRLMAQNIYTTQFATKAELTSSITQTRDAIELEVSEKLDEEDFTSANIMLKINDDTSLATIKADKINLNGVVTANDNFKINTDGSMEAKNGKFSGRIDLYDSHGSAVLFDIHSSENNEESTFFTSAEGRVGNHCHLGTFLDGGGFMELTGDGYTIVKSSGIITPEVIQTSKEDSKKNFEKLDKGLDIIKGIDIYKYNFKNENDDYKKHIGFVIGDKYKYSKEITSNENDGVDIYSFVSVCCKAIQEQQEQIEELKEKINKLEGGR